MSALEATAYHTWTEGLNPVAVAYRAYAAGESPKRTVLAYGCVYNALRAVGYAFYSIPHCISKRQTIHWTTAKLYSAFTLVCLKALWNYTTTMEQVRELVARRYLSTFLEVGSKEDLAPHFAALFAGLSADQQARLLANPTKLEPLYKNINLLHSLAESPQSHLYARFFDQAIDWWDKQIMAGKPISNDEIKALISLSNKLNHAKLRETLCVNLITERKLNALSPSWHQALCNNAEQILVKLLDTQFSPPLAPPLIRLLALLINQKRYSELLARCDQIARHPSPLKEDSSVSLVSCLNEFESAWQQFSPRQHLDVCLALYKIPALRKWIPIVGQKIPALAHQMVLNGKEEIPENCDAILAIHYQNLNSSEPQECLFEHLRTAKERNMPQLNRTCVKQILDKRLFQNASINTNQLESLIEALSAYSGPNVAEHGNDEIAKEGEALLQLAKQVLHLGLPLYEACVTFLKSKPAYTVAANHVNAQSELSLFLAGTNRRAY